MPRSSAEERSASYFRAGKKPAEPPRGMSAAARKIWREIVNSKPVDWFDAGSLQILRLHAENIAAANRVSRELARVKPGSREFRALSGDMKSLNASVGTSARQLRLTVQHAVDTRDQKAGERGAAGVADHLIGGRSLKVVDAAD